MRVRYDDENDVLAIDFREGAEYAESEEIYDGFVIDFDTSGKPMGLEIYQYASQFFDIPALLQHFPPEPRPVYVPPPPMYIRDAPIDKKKAKKKKS